MPLMLKSLGLDIRDAQPTDAAAAHEVLIASIRELCVDDHAGDPDMIAEWLANKSVLQMRMWISSPANHIFLAEADERVVGVGGMTSSGTVTLLYVSPEARLNGVSKALLSELENRARDLGLDELDCVSTATASRFFQSAGFTMTRQPISGIGHAPSFPMAKKLA